LFEREAISYPVGGCRNLFSLFTFFIAVKYIVKVKLFSNKTNRASFIILGGTACRLGCGDSVSPKNKRKRSVFYVLKEYDIFATHVDTASPKKTKEAAPPPRGDVMNSVRKLTSPRGEGASSFTFLMKQ
jgi:hypothetical protein